MGLKIKAVRGTKDILPKDSRIWHFIEERAKALCRNAGYREIRTPLLEEARLFSRSIGETSDIVRKEMYSFLDRKKRVLCLRPEATASVVRAYLEHDFDKSLGLAKFYYFGPMFRAERPQAGRLRQFHHIGVEAIGSLSPYLDAEVILLAVKILQEIGVKDFLVQLNSIGCSKDRQRYKLILKSALKNKLKLLCSDCLNRYKVNLLRIFDCKNETCRKVTSRLPSIIDSICPQCYKHFLKVRQVLDSLNISYVLNPHLVRGLDYYTKTCFEMVHPRLGAQNAVGAGGRYDDLVKDLGGPQKPAVGFALGVERLIAALEPASSEPCTKFFPGVFIAAIGEESKELACKILHTLREKGISSEIDYLDKSLKGQMRLADKLGFKYVAILGEEELKKRTVILRNMQDKSQKELKIDNLAEELT
ncbi:MAG: histidine--tRNA ligase [Candidatus Omnitrophica bacterium]|nr:histidine--tRNA ligase [Candidatus Omnitrophota bacterium]